MGYYADAERHYDPESAPIARWKKRDKMTGEDVVKIIEDFLEQVANGGKDYKWCSGEFGAPVELRIAHPGTPSYEDARFSLAETPGYGDDSVLTFKLGAFSRRYYLVDLTDVEKLQKQVQEAAQGILDRLTSWDDEQAEAEEDDTFEDSNSSDEEAGDE